MSTQFKQSLYGILIASLIVGGVALIVHLNSSNPKFVRGASDGVLFQTQNTDGFEAQLGFKKDPSQIVFKREKSSLSLKIPVKNVKWEKKDDKLYVNYGDITFIYSLLINKKGEALGIKEEIILKKPIDNDIMFEFPVSFENLEAKKKDGLWHFYDKKGNDLFYIPKPFMEDSQGHFTEKVDIKIENGTIKIIPDNNWLRDPKRAYPVIIDPTLKLTILNVHSHPQAGDNWAVSFETQGTFNLTITPDDQPSIDDLDFISLKCGTENRSPQILENDVIFYPNWFCDGTGEIVHIVNVARPHTLKFQFDDQTAYAYNNPDSVTDYFDTNNPDSDPTYYISSTSSVVVSGGQVKLATWTLNETTCNALSGWAWLNGACWSDSIMDYVSWNKGVGDDTSKTGSYTCNTAGTLQSRMEAVVAGRWSEICTVINGVTITSDYDGHGDAEHDGDVTISALAISDCVDGNKYWATETIGGIDWGPRNTVLSTWATSTGSALPLPSEYNTACGEAGGTWYQNTSTLAPGSNFSWGAACGASGGGSWVANARALGNSTCIYQSYYYTSSTKYYTSFRVVVRP